MTARLLMLAVLASGVVVTWVLAFVSHRVEDAGSGIQPLAPIVYEDLSLVTLGTGGSAENHLRLGPAIAVGLGDTVVLVDTGRGVAESLRRAAIPVHQPRVVLLTSLLAENTVGLDDLMLTGALSGRSAPLDIYGPAGTAALVESLAAAHRTAAIAQDEMLGRPAGASSGVGHDVDADFTLSAGPLTLRAGDGGGSPLARLIWRAEGTGRSVVVSGAGGDPELLVGFGRAADLWATGALVGASLDAALAEATREDGELMRREAAQHLRLEDVGDIASRMGVDVLVLHRLRPPPIFVFPLAAIDPYKRLLAESFRGAVVLAEDGETVTP